MCDLRPLSRKALAAGKRFNNDGTDNYAYAFGFFQSDVENIISLLNLTKKQQKMLDEYLAKEGL